VDCRIAAGDGLLYLGWEFADPPEEIMAWTTPTLVEICIGLEINGYLPAEF
jgi:coenzyme PQQ precursor peptide PqqA